MSGTDLVKGFQDPLIDIIFCQAQIQRAEGDIIEDRRHKELIVRILEYHAYRAADVGKRCSGQRGMSDIDVAGRSFQIAVQMLQKYLQIGKDATNIEVAKQLITALKK